MHILFNIPCPQTLCHWGFLSDLEGKANLPAFHSTAVRFLRLCTTAHFRITLNWSLSESCSNWICAALCQQTAQSTLGAQRRDLHWLKAPAQGRAVHQSTKPQPRKGPQQNSDRKRSCRLQKTIYLKFLSFFCPTRSCNGSCDI